MLPGFLALVGMGAACAAQTDLSFKPLQSLPVGTVTLGQVANIQASPEWMERLSVLPVARMGEGVSELQLNAVELRRIVLRKLRLDARALSWSGQQALTVHAEHMVAGEWIVLRHDPLEVSTRQGRVTVASPAVAMSRGRRGDEINVRLPSGAIARARVAGPGKAVF